MTGLTASAPLSREFKHIQVRCLTSICRSRQCLLSTGCILCCLQSSLIGIGTTYVTYFSFQAKLLRSFRTQEMSSLHPFTPKLLSVTALSLCSTQYLLCFKCLGKYLLIKTTDNLGNVDFRLAWNKQLMKGRWESSGTTGPGEGNWQPSSDDIGMSSLKLYESIKCEACITVSQAYNFKHCR